MQVDVKKELEGYVRTIQEKYNSSMASEHTLRTPLENLLNTIKEDDIRIVHEAKRDRWEAGTPDFKVFRQMDQKDKLSYPHLIGYIECKKLNEDLDSILKSPQIVKYLEVSPNIILTDHNRFILLSFDKVIEDLTLVPNGFSKDKQNSDTIFISKTTVEIFTRMLDQFYGATTRRIVSKNELAKVLSSQAFYLGVKTREFICDKRNKASKFRRYFTKSFESLKNAVDYDFNIEEFCDIFGQSVVYGLFVIHAEDAIECDATTLDIAKLIPEEFSLLAEFIHFSAPVFSVPDSVQYVIENIKRTIDLIDRDKLAEELNTDIEGISVYLYEDFLVEFDKLRGTEKRKENGVYYTPEPVVKFIIKTIDKILKEKFGLKKGFAEDGVKTLDVAAGTGSFMAAVFERIIEEAKSSVFKIDAIKNKFLKDVCGFEMMIVPYIVAHIKLASILKREGFKDFNDENRLQVYLTNTLDLDDRDLQPWMSAELSKECEEAEYIKKQENVTVIVGNPPYNGNSKIKGEKILSLLKEYRNVTREQRNKKNLNDDYVKFIRFAQWKLLEQSNKNKQGAIGFVTNNSFLSCNAHRKMRESLYNSFDDIYIVDLHGNSLKKEPCKNIFNICVGVCIIILVKYPESTIEKNVFYYSALENGILERSKKLELLERDVEYKKLNVSSPEYWFVPREEVDDDYDNFISVPNIFETKACGIFTKNDLVAYQRTEKDIEILHEDFKSLTKSQLREKYNIVDNAGWKLDYATIQLTNPNNNIKVTKLLFQPFNYKYTLYGKERGFIDSPRYDLMHNLSHHNNNLALLISRNSESVGEKVWNSVFVSSTITNLHVFRRGGQHTFPAYTYEPYGLDGKVLKVPNFTDKFKIILKQKPYADVDPKDIIHYIYAILNTPTYRVKYTEYMRTDFPRIPFTDDLNLFTELAGLGKKLTELHILDTPPTTTICKLEFIDQPKHNASHIIKSINSKNRYSDNTIYLNDDLCIRNVEEEVWNYNIGGYQVINKWIKDHVDYECGKNDLEHLVNICNALHETIGIQGELDALWNRM